MPRGIPINTQASTMLDNIQVKTAVLPEEENNERIKRLARKIHRSVENCSRNKLPASEDQFANATLEQDLAI